MLRRCLRAEANVSESTAVTSSRHHNQYVDGAACFWTSSVINHVPILASRTAALRLLSIWDRYRGKYGVRVLGYVVMPDHFHLVIWAERAESVKRFLRWSLHDASVDLTAMTRDAAARGVSVAAIWLNVFEQCAGSGATAALWKERGRGFPITDGDALRQKLQYIHGNPVRRGLVATPEEWEFSSASWYADGSGPLRMDSVDGW